MNKLTTLKGFLEAIKGENDSQSSSSVDSDDIISDNGKDEDFVWEKSNFSCFARDIKSFVVGGMSSKFWQTRKLLNLIQPNEYTNDPDNVPFYAWNCITLSLGYAYIDLVIPKDRDMRNFVRYLTYSTDTMDGTNGSSLNL